MYGTDSHTDEEVKQVHVICEHTGAVNRITRVTLSETFPLWTTYT